MYEYSHVIKAICHYPDNYLRNVRKILIFPISNEKFPQATLILIDFITVMFVFVFP